MNENQNQHHPLHPVSPEESARLRSGVGPSGVDENLNPIPLNPEEVLAADHPGEAALMSEPVPQFHVPSWLIMLAGTIGSSLAALALVLPAQWQFPVAALGGIALFLAGKPFPTFSWAGGHPLIPLALVPIFLTVSTALVTWAAMLPAGKLHAVLILAAVICAGLAGKAAPQTATAAPAV